MWGTATPFLRPDYDGIGIVSSPTKAVALPLNAHVPTAEDISLLLSVNVRNAVEGGVTVVGTTRTLGADYLGLCLAGMPDNQTINLMATAPVGQRTFYPERIVGTGSPLEACRRADNRYNWQLNTSSDYGKPSRHNHSSRRNVRAFS